MNDAVHDKKASTAHLADPSRPSSFRAGIFSLALGMAYVLPMGRGFLH